MLCIEFAVICALIPSLIIANLWAPYMFAFLWGVALYAFVIYRWRLFETWRALWRWDAVTTANMKPILIRWALASAALVGFAALYDPERLFFLLRERPEILPGLILLYPPLSALPQEFIFCSFLFARYRPLFGDGRVMVAVSAIVFAYAHILYINPVAPALSLLGGLIFALTYRRHKSLALVTLEHALFGYTLFVSGLGWYFYSGGVTGG